MLDLNERISRVRDLKKSKDSAMNGIRNVFCIAVFPYLADRIPQFPFSSKQFLGAHETALYMNAIGTGDGAC